MSFDFNTDNLMASAAEMFNNLWPIFAGIVGLSLGVKLISFVRKEVTGAF